MGKREKHSMTNTALYGLWCGMKTRCYNHNFSQYKDYGGRGITVCDRWRNSFKNFYEDMGDRPEGMTLDRIDNDGNYEPSNCRWATTTTQALNTRKKRIVVCGETVGRISIVARENNISLPLVYGRMRCGWSLNDALSIPVGTRRRNSRYITFNGETHNINTWGRLLGIKPCTISARLRKGKPLSDVLNATEVSYIAAATQQQQEAMAVPVED